MATAVMALLIVCAIGGAFLLGRLVTSPSQKALQEAPASVQSYAVVEQRTVNATERITGTLSSGQSSAIGTSAVAASPVVTHMPLSPGAKVLPLQYLGSLGEQPVFAMSASIPLFRDLKLGDRGNDVFMLQNFLSSHGFPGVSSSGSVDAVTLEAVRLVYTNQGLEAPGKTAKDTVFHHAHFLRFGDGSGIVTKAAAVASSVSEKSPLLTISRGDAIVTARVTLPTADEIRKGDVVGLAAGEKTATGTVTDVGDFRTDDSGISARDVTVRPDGNLSSVSTVSITPKGTAGPGPAVPMIALREENGQTYVMAARSRSDEPRRINVKVLRQADGWAAIAPETDLPVGSVLWIP
ncbi:hypothetical protein [Falsarthrobacter nasiphocae]|uniref:Peptidoglycan binding domain-containing protein n=1 Tax=Falsarthrobacter nasiphocae TaxID=189863 RepID=A0AAE3YHL2_9MICC|nr:hypothetical protein [Falsarthrobacter nasiphocae]MDR6892166.1 hypothetical protein [Falsarthrobacter nasiphocae]